MRKFTFSFKTLLVAFLLMGGVGSAWADDLPTPVYSQNFESASTTVGEAGSNFGITGATLSGNGAIKTDGAVFGKYYQNMPDAKNGAKTERTNYLTIKTDAFSEAKTAGNNAITISFWLNTYAANTKGLNDWTASIFVAYNAAGNAAHGSTCGMDTRSCFAVHSNINNSEFYYDKHGGGPSGNYDTSWLPNGTNFANSWHHVVLVYSVDATNPANKKTIITQYIDGVQKNQYSFENGGADKTKTELDYLDAFTEFVIGGNSPIWVDKDNAYAYDEINIYSSALSAEQITQLYHEKCYSYTANGIISGGSTILKTLATGYVVKGASVDIAYPQFINHNGTLYSKDAISSEFKYTFTPASEGTIENLAYAATEITNVVLYTEGEEIRGATVQNNGGCASRTSNRSTGVATNAKLATLPAGSYNVMVYFYNTNSGAQTVTISDGESALLTYSFGQTRTNATKALVLNKTTSLYITGGDVSTNNPKGIDLVYITGTPTPTCDIIGAVDCSIDYLKDMSDLVTLNPGDTYKYKFINHNMGPTAGWAQNWILPVYASDGTTKKIVIRADNWEDIAWKNVGFAWTASSGNWYDDFITEIDGATVDMTVNYSAGKVFTMNSTITTSTGRTLTYSYNSSNADVTLTDDAIKVALSISMSWLELAYEGITGTVPATVTSAGWATLYTPYPLDFSGAGLTAYTAAVDGNNIVLTEVADVPANTGVVLKGDEGPYNIPVIASSETAKGDLTGNVSAATACPAPTNHTYYILTKDGDKAQFNPATSGEIAAGKAFLDVTTGGGIKVFNVIVDGTATGVEAPVAAEAAVEDGVYYNLNGQQVTKDYKGIVIVNGKKFYNK